MSWLNKKLISVTLVGSLVMGSVALLPISSTGLVNKAYASDAMEDKIVSINNHIAAGADKTAVDLALAKLSELTDVNLVSEFSSRITTAINGSPAYPALTPTNILALFKKIGAISYADTSGLEAFRVDSDLRPVMNQLTALGGGPGDLRTIDFYNFFLSIETSVKAAVFANPSLLSDTTAMKNLVDAKLSIAVADHSLVLSNIFITIGITPADVVAVKNKIVAAVDASAGAGTSSAAAKAVIRAYIVSTLFPTPTPTPTPTTPPGTPGTPGTPGASTSPTPTVTPTPTPAAIATPAPGVKEEAAKGLDNALEVLKENADKIGDNQAGLKKATEAVQDAIEKQSQLDVSKLVTVTGDKVKVEIDAKQFKDLFKAVKEDADKLNDKLKAVDANAEKASVTVTLDLGKQDVNNAEVPISADLVKEAKDAGIDKIAVKVNGVSLSVDVDQFKGNTTLNIDKQPAATATNATNLKVASDVYNFEFSDASNNNVSFTKPVVIKLPIANVDGLNTDILVLAKIINGKLEFYGGKYNAAGKYFESERKSFSSYVIVENKVEFNDTASVQAWAGKEIGIAAAKGIVQGRGEGVFAPNDKVTRAEFATMIVKTFHLEDSTAPSTFADVKASDWFASSVAAAAKAGLINGRTSTSFEPNATISRAEMATISARALKSVKGYKNTSDNAAALAKFNDAASINISLTEGVALASSQGVVVGNNNNFNPNGLSTRAEAAVVISRLLNL
jgi:hypothetical protein